jgi:hypothetical protein
MRQSSVVLLLLGCSGRDGDGRRPPSLSCAVQPDNLLRYDCTVTLARAAPATLRWGPLDRPDEREATSPSAREHAFTIWGLRAGIEHEVRGVAGGQQATLAIVPATLPESWVPDVVVTGESTGEAVLLPLRCAPEPTLAILDTEGRILAYQVLEGAELSGYNWTRDGTLLALLDNDRVLEHDLLGRRVTDLSASAGDFDGPAHHEVHRGPDGLLWLLAKRSVRQDGVPLKVDRVVALDADGQVAEWLSTDHLLAPLDPARARDATHGNGIWADEAGDLYVSLREISTVLKIAGDPGAPGFGEVRWRLTGGHTPEPSDFAIVSTNGATDVLDFDGQHNPNLGPDGRLGLFDNRRALGPTARALFFDLDLEAGTADVVEAYELGQDCPNQGAALSLPDGRRLVTCAESAAAYEYVPGAATPSWTVRAACPSAIGRIFPVDLP